MMAALAETVLQMGMTNYQLLRSYARQLRKFCYTFYTSAVYV